MIPTSSRCRRSSSWCCCSISCCRRLRARAPRRRAGRRARSDDASRCGSFRTVVDPLARLRVEEVQGAGVDDCLDLLPFLDARTRAETADHDRLAFPCTDVRRFLGARVVCELAGLVGLGVRALDGEVGDDLRAERLAKLEPPAQMPVARSVSGERYVLEIFGADPDDHPLALVAF